MIFQKKRLETTWLADMKRLIKNSIKKAMVKFFHLGQRMGFDILPRHFYSEIPDIRKLKCSDHWRKPFSMIGIDGADIERQLDFVADTVPVETSE